MRYNRALRPKEVARQFHDTRMSNVNFLPGRSYQQTGIPTEFVWKRP